MKKIALFFITVFFAQSLFYAIGKRKISFPEIYETILQSKGYIPETPVYEADLNVEESKSFIAEIQGNKGCQCDSNSCHAGCFDFIAMSDHSSELRITVDDLSLTPPDLSIAENSNDGSQVTASVCWSWPCDQEGRPAKRVRINVEVQSGGGKIVVGGWRKSEE